MPEHCGLVAKKPRPVVVFRRSALAKAAAVLASVTFGSVLVIGALLAPSLLGGHRAARSELLSDDAQAGFVMPPFADDFGGGQSSSTRDRFGMVVPPKSQASALKHRQKHLRSSLLGVLPPAYVPAVPPAVIPPQHYYRQVPATKNYEHVRYHKVPTGEVAYYGDARYGPWFAEHKHKDAEAGEAGEEGDDKHEINTYPSDCTSGCDLKQSRMLEAAEGMVKVAMDTHTSREAAYKEQLGRNKKWAKRINKMLEKMVPEPPSGVCHKTVDCEDCAGIKKEGLCRQKLGIWVPEVHVIASANKEADKDTVELNEEVRFYTHTHAHYSPPHLV